MTNTFKFYVGGTGGIKTTATAICADYTTQLLRCSYTKRFLDDYSFDATIEGINISDTYIQLEQNVFFTINDGANDWLLMKGYITEIEWVSKKRVRIKGSHSMRDSSGGKGQLNRSSLPERSEQSEVSLDQLIKMSEATLWYGQSKSAWDDDIVAGEATGRPE